MGSQFLCFSFIIPLKHLNIQGHSFFFFVCGGVLERNIHNLRKRTQLEKFSIWFLTILLSYCTWLLYCVLLSCWFVWLIYFFINIWNGHSSSQVLLTPTHLAIVMEYAAGGELFERICSAGRFSEDEVD